MNIFSNKKAADGDQVETDFIGGGGGAINSDIYTAKIKVAYMGKSSSSKAISVNLIMEVNGKELRETVWVSNRNGDVTYKDKTTKEDKNLPGYSAINGLCMLVAQKDLGSMEVEELTQKLFDYDSKSEIPQQVDCFVELHGEMVQIAVQKQTVDKTKKDDNGVYQPTGETRDQNEVIKFFPEDKAVTLSEISEHIKTLGGTLNEILADGDLPKAVESMPSEDGMGPYAVKWLEMNKDQTRNMAKGAGKTEGKSFTKGGDKPTAKKSSGLFSD